MKIWDGSPEGAFRSSKWTGDIRGVLLPDIHIPIHDWRKLEIVYECISDHKLDFGLQFGDLLDFDALGRWSKDKPGKVEGERMVHDFGMAADFWDSFTTAVRSKNPDAKVYGLEGNHEARIHRFCDEVPYFKGIFHLPNILEFDERKVQWIPSFSESQMLRLDWKNKALYSRVLGRSDWTAGTGVAFIHGWYCGMHHAKKTSDSYGRAMPIIYGHTHDVQVYTSHAFGWPRPFSASIGHLRLADAEYITGPDRWHPAFAFISLAAESEGIWDIQIIRICEDVFGNSHFFGPNGKRYTSRVIHGT